MIRVNLAKNSAAKKQGFSFGGRSESAASADFTADGENLNRTLIVRLALLFMGSGLLFAYEQLNVPPLKSQMAQMQRELEEVRQKNLAGQNDVDEIKRYEKEQEKLQAQINAIEEVKRDRLREVRVLDYIQREIPEKVWLSQMDLNNGRLVIAGYATADNELTTFMESLQRSAYLRDISLVRSNDLVLADVGTVKRFEISCSMEKTP